MSLRPFWTPLLAGIAACALIAGCGGSSQPKSSAKPAVDPLIAKTATPKLTVALLYSDIVNEHPDEACQLVTGRGADQFVKRVGAVFKLKTCRATAFQIGGLAKGTRLGRVVQTGDKARIRVLVGGVVGVVVNLINTPAGWRVDGFKT